MNTTTGRRVPRFTAFKRTAELAPTDPPKNLFTTKDAAINFAIGIGSFVPAIGTWEAAHPATVVWGFVILNVALRAISHGRTYLFGGD